MSTAKYSISFKTVERRPFYTAVRVWEERHWLVRQEEEVSPNIQPIEITRTLSEPSPSPGGSHRRARRARCGWYRSSQKFLLDGRVREGGEWSFPRRTWGALLGGQPNAPKTPARGSNGRESHEEIEGDSTPRPGIPHVARPTRRNY